MIRHLILLFVLIFLSGCARLNTTPKLNYRTVETTGINDPREAEAKHELAIQRISNCRYAEAEQCLQEALLADVSFGPAHNSLGKIYFDQKKFYFAAWEFEYAMKTMPNRAEPVNNLGLVYESVGQIEEAIAMYQQATEIDPDNPQYLGNLLRARIRNGEQADVMVPMLERLVFLDDRRQWVDWAKGLLATSRPEPTMELESTPELLPYDYEIIEPIIHEGPGGTTGNSALGNSEPGGEVFEIVPDGNSSRVTPVLKSPLSLSPQPPE